MTPPRVGFLEESPNVRSMTRLVMLLNAGSVVALVVTLCVVAIVGTVHGRDVAWATAALAAPLGTLVAAQWGIVRDRNRGTDDAAPVP